MKTIVPVLLVLAASQACGQIEKNYEMMPLRSDRYENVRLPDRPDSSDTVGKTEEGALLVCGVRLPDSYDWQKDTAIGMSKDGQVVLYSDFEEVRAFNTGYDAGVSTDPDTHHIIGGHLYTEFTGVSKTVITKDGERYLTYEGREMLLGLLEYGGCVYTLARSKADGSIVFRKDGALVFSHDSGEVFGSFSDDSYPESGAIYEESGKIYFAYRSFSAGMVTNHIVVNGIDNQLDNGRFVEDVEDIKVVGGRMYSISSQSPGILVEVFGNVWYCLMDYTFDKARIYVRDGQLWIGGPSYNQYLGTRQFVVQNQSDIVEWISSEHSSFVCWKMDNERNVSEPVFVPSSGYGSMFFSRSSVCLKDDDLCRISNSRQKGISPRLFVGDKEYLFNFNGYLTGVSYVGNQK